MNITLKKLIELQELTRQSADENHPKSLQKKIDFLRMGLPEHILRRFDHLTTYHKLAVTQITASGACNSCHMKLPPADALRIRSSSDQLATCPFCECFLYSTAALFDELNPIEIKQNHD